MSANPLFMELYSSFNKRPNNAKVFTLRCF